ncbi:sterol desaturase family protein [Caulobacter segnis]|uniref:sterol desaturase family protein n=1 Tax=Caulobacter segnis TaxID=88688 RepID=UPI00240F2B0C|nr:sterol desaturase family protein [Caulobacter segnis]MDG2520612.1 sterol desaturase family protein [Caulobacter segnis]
MIANLLWFFGALAAMEGVAWATHRYVMHGPLWSWHRSHHEPRRGVFELNDLFAVVFAGLAIGLFAVGAATRIDAFTFSAAGVTAYGALYALVHDGLVHRRFWLPLKPRRGYLLRLVQAHHLHHLHHERLGAVSFGFLVPLDPRRLAEKLKRQRETLP